MATVKLVSDEETNARVGAVFNDICETRKRISSIIFGVRLPTIRRN